MPPTVIAYPSVREYSDALQAPKSCFATGEMKRCVPEKDANNLPMPRTGGVAAVFKLDVGGTFRALKVFRGASAQREERYRAISDYLGTFRCRHLVGFSYNG